MPNIDSRENLYKELSSVFEKRGISIPKRLLSDLSIEDFQKVRTLAMGIVNGEIDIEKINALQENLSTLLDEMVTALMRLKSSPRLRELEESNPFFNAFGSKIIRDSQLVIDGE